MVAATATWPMIQARQMATTLPAGPRIASTPGCVGPAPSGQRAFAHEARKAGLTGGGEFAVAVGDQCAE
ncbi:hypothetical protein RZS08_65940, partial [Arthrospira platensis SPKY1]|nr:hypothetical protein [Arthrospira platensis SPKY1]